MITHAWVGSDLTFHLKTKKAANLAKILNMKEFVKMMRFPHEYIKIYYCQEMEFDGKAFRKLLKSFEVNYYDYRDYQYDDRRNKFEYHCAFYFFHYLRILNQRSTKCTELFKGVEDKRTNKKLCMIEILTRFKEYPIKIIKHQSWS